MQSHERALPRRRVVGIAQVDDLSRFRITQMDTHAKLLHLRAYERLLESCMQL